LSITQQSTGTLSPIAEPFVDDNLYARFSALGTIEVHIESIKEEILSWNITPNSKIELRKLTDQQQDGSNKYTVFADKSTLYSNK